MQKWALDQVWDRIERDLSESYTLLYFSADRVLGSGNTNRDEHEKIFSVSDRSASFIKKVQRDPVFGYKAQLGRSKNGFVNSVLVPEGNAADSRSLDTDDHSRGIFLPKFSKNTLWFLRARTRVG